MNLPNFITHPDLKTLSESFSPCLPQSELSRFQNEPLYFLSEVTVTPKAHSLLH